MPQLIISAKDIRENLIIIQDSRYSHIKSLRIKKGEQVRFLEESGKVHTAVLSNLRGHSAVFEILHTTEGNTAGSGIILAQSIIKKERMSLAVQKATELGVDAIIPFLSRYTVVRAKENKFRSRYEAVIREAVGQCMRTTIPRFDEPLDYRALIRNVPGTFKILFHYGDTAGPLAPVSGRIKQSRQVMLIIGPEGGFSAAEIDLALANHAAVVRLDGNILRSETAAIAAISTVSFIRNG